MFSAEGKTWKSDRPMLAPVMNKGYVDMYDATPLDWWTNMLPEGGSMAVIINEDVCSATIDIQALFFEIHHDGWIVYTGRLLCCYSRMPCSGV
jgi:hypothetical protein